jgi:hypothetical protein
MMMARCNTEFIRGTISLVGMLVFCMLAIAGVFSS